MTRDYRSGIRNSKSNCSAETGRGDETHGLFDDFGSVGIDSDCEFLELVDEGSSEFDESGALPVADWAVVLLSDFARFRQLPIKVGPENVEAMLDHL